MRVTLPAGIGDDAAAGPPRAAAPALEPGGFGLPRANPFASRFIRPGALPFLGPDPGELVRRLEAAAGWGEIIGPHGSGKSTLVAALLAVVPPGWEPRLVRLSAGGRSLPADAWAPWAGRGLLVIDGFEQLGWLEARRVRRHCRRLGAGLVVTAHTATGLPPLCRTDVTPEIAAAVVDRLLAGRDRGVLAGYDLAGRLRALRGSLRDLLGELYDRWELLHRGPA